ncbi:hypothetical protein PQ465_11045 [Sphingobacterium oryzagri]|uniref:GLPGLI family protein n=1 Tax=Sphingobacterium oryzagri TaxID=3025669 RepID=A0ABY7WB03_9SPHI|nr:hypothetical protein [Sphingobacterium sp. KACC 22765]WDF66841.1 hypothetical protein PQ465_11045 [Sphingobacterium sp. KACC 22765]
MTTIFALRLFIGLTGLCVITMGYAHAQKMLVKLVGSLREAAVINAYILPVDYNEYAVKKEKGLAYMEESSDVGISPVHYPDKTIRLAAPGAAVPTMLRRPKTSIALAGFVITKQADKAVSGIWGLKKIAALKVYYKGTNERRRDKPVPAQVPEYSADASLRVSVRDRPLMNRPYPGVKNQLYESVFGANSKPLTDHGNRLLDLVRENHKPQMFTYQVPKSVPALEKVWKKIPTTDHP